MVRRRNQVKARNWLIVINNFADNADEGKNFLHDLWATKFFNKCKYACGQIEKGEQGTIHLQAFANFKQQIRFAALKRAYPTAHLDEVKVNNGAHNYCMKEETRLHGPWEFGERPVQRNNKVDWDNVKKLAQQGKLDDLPSDIYVRHYSNLKQIVKDSMRPVDKKHLRGIWLYGPPGIGKSYTARKVCKDLGMDFYPKFPTHKWFDGYQQQQIVVMDDVGKDQRILGNHFKIWADRYGCILEHKGGAVVDNYEWFIVTSQYHPCEIWYDDQQTLDAIDRRFICLKEEDIKKLKLRFDYPEDVPGHGLDLFGPEHIPQNYINLIN